MPARTIRILACALVLVLGTAPAVAAAPEAEGLVVQESAHDVATTVDRLDDVLRAKGLTIFTHIDHAAGAAAAGEALPPTRVVIFGNPRVGTPLMRCARSVAIDLPQKVLVWEDEAGNVWIAYNDPGYLAARHAIEGCDEVLAKVTAVLAAVTREAAQPETAPMD